MLRRIYSGTFVDTVFDMISLAGSISEALEKKNDPLAWACVVGDAIDLIPGVTGVGELIKGSKIALTMLNVATAGTGVAAAAKGVAKVGKKVGGILGDAFESAAKRFRKKADLSDEIVGASYDINKLVKTQSYVDNCIVSSMKDSILKSGPNAVPPISVRVHHGEALVVQGHHRLEAFEQLGYGRVPINYVHASQLGKIQKDGDYFRTIEELLSGRIYN